MMCITAGRKPGSPPHPEPRVTGDDHAGWSADLGHRATSLLVKTNYLSVHEKSLQKMMGSSLLVREDLGTSPRLLEM